jgi:hypothetical protein
VVLNDLVGAALIVAMDEFLQSCFFLFLSHGASETMAQQKEVSKLETDVKTETS